MTSDLSAGRRQGEAPIGQGDELPAGQPLTQPDEAALLPRTAGGEGRLERRAVLLSELTGQALQAHWELIRGEASEGGQGELTCIQRRRPSLRGHRRADRPLRDQGVCRRLGGGVGIDQQLISGHQSVRQGGDAEQGHARPERLQAGLPKVIIADNDGGEPLSEAEYIEHDEE